MVVLTAVSFCQARGKTFPLLTMCNVEIRQMQMRKRKKSLLCNLISAIRGKKLYCSPLSTDFSASSHRYIHTYIGMQ